MGSKTSYFENKLIDLIFRGQAFNFPSTLYLGLFSVAPTETTAGTEISGGGYARVGVVCSLANFAGTQGAGTTVASSGDSGSTSNNTLITFPTPTADWGQVVGAGIFDSSESGNLLYYSALTNNKTINLGDPAPTFPAGSLVITED